MQIICIRWEYLWLYNKLVYKQIMMMMMMMMIIIIIIDNDNNNNNNK